MLGSGVRVIGGWSKVLTKLPRPVGGVGQKAMDFSPAKTDVKAVEMVAGLVGVTVRDAGLVGWEVTESDRGLVAGEVTVSDLRRDVPEGPEGPAEMLSDPVTAAVGGLLAFLDDLDLDVVDLPAAHSMFHVVPSARSLEESNVTCLLRTISRPSSSCRILPPAMLRPFQWRTPHTYKALDLVQQYS